MTPIKILIADDEELICSSLRKKFIRLGYEVIVAHDGKSALAIAQNENPHIALLDVKMPKLSGIEVCKRLKSKKETKDIYVIMFSARAEQNDIETAKEVGADSYLCKPIPFNLIKEQVDKFVGKIG